MNPLGAGDIEALLKRIRGEYLEMPDLRITGAQAQRLWGLDETRCQALLGALVDSGFLARTRDGAFVRSTSSLRARVVAFGDRVDATRP